MPSYSALSFDGRLIVRRAHLEEVPHLEALVRACGHGLALKGFRNWLPPYPGDAVRRDAAWGELYVGLCDGQLLGTFALNHDDGGRYAPDTWQDDSASARYLHRLAVRPGLQGRGWGLALLRAAERISHDLGAQWLRLDANAANASLIAFYVRAGYVLRGEIVMALGRSDLPELRLVCLEHSVAHHS